MFKKIRILKDILAALYIDFINRDGIEKKYNCKIDKRAVLNISDLSRVVIGSGVSIGACTVITLIDYDGNKKISKLEIGDSTYVGEHNNIRAAGGTVKIGNDCLISQNVQIIAANHSVAPGVPIAQQPWSEKNNFVEIGNDVWIGCGAIILPGVKIGHGSIIAAGCIVTKSVPDRVVVAGIPGRIIKNRE